MKILPVNNFCPKHQCSQFYHFEQKKSFGIKNNNFCFKGQDLLDLPEKDLFKRISESINPENFIGQGTEAEVYKIKNTDYCVRIPYETQDLYVMNYSKNLSSTDKVNHTKAKLGFGATIMKFFEGDILKHYINNKEQRYKLQSDIANMPIKSYTELLHQIAEAIDNEMLFDFSGGNLIIDTKNNKLTAIDFIEMSENPREIKPLNEMYSVLTCYGAENNTGRKIFQNIITAGLEEFKTKNNMCMDPELFDFVELCRKRCNKIAENENNELLIQKISYQVDSLKKLKKVEYIEKLISSFIEEKIEVITNLIKRIK